MFRSSRSVDPVQTTANEVAIRVTGRELVRDYGKGDSAVHALCGVSLSVMPGELVAIMGPSGSGKSTLMHILAGLDQPTSGTVWIDDVAISALSDDALTKLRRAKVGFIFQSFNLLPMLTADENIRLPLAIAGAKPDAEWLDELIASVGMQARRLHRPSELSGGQQQRVAIARALVTRPSVVFADEPTGNLDSTSSREVLGMLRDAVDQLGQTVVMVTHDPQAAAIADRVLFLADGQIVKTLNNSTAADVLVAMQEVTDR